MLTPNALEVLIHYHTCRSPHPRLEAPAVKDDIHYFVDSGIFVKKDLCNITGPSSQYTYCVTEKGKAWLTMILRTPCPVNRWTDPRTNGIIKEEAP